MRIFLSDGRRRERAESGYGQISAGLLPELAALGHDVVFDLDRDCDVCLYVCPPSSMRPAAIPIPTVAYTMHELEELPEAKRDWVETLNAVDLVVTPTEWNERVWRHVGVTAPIAVVPLGIDPTIYFPSKPTTFRILSAHENLGGTSSRENWRDTLRAFLSTFTPRDTAELRVKTWKWKPEAFEVAIYEEMRDLGVTDRPAIVVISNELSADEMRTEYQHCGLFVKNANREGWGLPATEAVACGAAIAASRIQPLLSHLDPHATFWFETGDVATLSAIMREQHTAYETSLRRARSHTWKNSAELLDRALAQRFT